MLVGTVTDDVRLLKCPKLTVCALRVTEPARARILKNGGTIMTFDELAMLRPTGTGTVRVCLFVVPTPVCTLRLLFCCACVAAGFGVISALLTALVSGLAAWPEEPHRAEVLRYSWCAALHHSPARALQGTQVREGPWPPQVAWLQGVRRPHCVQRVTTTTLATHPSTTRQRAHVLLILSKSRATFSLWCTGGCSMDTNFDPPPGLRDYRECCNKSVLKSQSRICCIGEAWDSNILVYERSVVCFRRSTAAFDSIRPQSRPEEASWRPQGSYIT